MKLHIAGPKPDWEEVSPEHQNFWQRYAASTRGVLTPGNMVSLIGLGFVLWGLADLSSDTLNGLLKITLGRLMDLLDGMVAHKSGTKSHLGEAVDAAVDKIVLVAALPVMIYAGILPLAVGLLIAAQNLFNVIFAAFAKLKKLELHPSRNGKMATGLQWCAIALYLFAALVDNYSVVLLAHVTTLISLVFGATATYGYGKDLLSKP